MSVADQVEQLGEKLTQSSFFNPESRRFLKYLITHRDGGRDKLSEAAIATGLSKKKSEDVRHGCHKVRTGLQAFFLYDPVGQREMLQLALPAADNEPDHTYHLKFGAGLHRLKGPGLFWQPYFLGDEPTSVIFTEPLAFRDKQRRFFIRHLDVNSDKNLSSQIEQLVEYLPNLSAQDLVISRGFIPGGEVFAKDVLRNWFQNHASELRRQYQIKTLKRFDELVSRHIEYSELDHTNLILLGASRTNHLIPDLQSRYGSKFRYLMTDRGIEIRNPNPAEAELLQKLHAKDNVVPEDWNKESMVLVTRGPGLVSRYRATTIAANQGRGMHGMAKYLTDERDIIDLIGDSRVGGSLPEAFQMVFRLELAPDGEADTWAARLLLFNSIGKEQH